MTTKPITAFLCSIIFLCGPFAEACSDFGQIISPEYCDTLNLLGIDRIVGIKSLEQKDGNLSDAYFIFEKLTPLNKPNWDTLAKHFPKNLYGNRINYLSGQLAFQTSLKISGIDRDEAEDYGDILPEEVWIGSVALKNPLTHPFRASDVEMVCSVFISKTAPITTHMGIFRNFELFGAPFEHKNLSIELHGFMAKISLMLNPDVKMMITKPVKKMREILLEHFNNEPNQIWIGDDWDRVKIKRELEQSIEKTSAKEGKRVKVDEEIDFALIITRLRAHVPNPDLLDTIHDLLEEIDQLSPSFGEKSVFNNLEAYDLSITMNGIAIPFRRPRWFKHENLGIFELQPTVIVSLNALQAKW